MQTVPNDAGLEYVGTDISGNCGIHEYSFGYSLYLMSIPKMITEIFPFSLIKQLP